MENEFKILDGAIGFDHKSNIAYYIVPLTSLGKTTKKGRNFVEVKSHPYYVDSKYNFWALSQEEQEKRKVYLTTIPFFYKGYEPWKKQLIEQFVKSKQDDIFDELDVYQDVFDPIRLIVNSVIDFHNPVFATLITLWIMGTYLSPIFDAYPYIFLSGTRGSGKTKVLEFVRYLAFSALLTSNASASSVFRIAQANKATLLIDEGEMLSHSKESAELRLILNAGYRKNNPVMRTNKDSFMVEFFDVTVPKMIAAINPLEATLKSRCIELVMIRTADKKKGNKRINDTSEEWELMRDALYRYGLLRMARAKEIYETDPEVNILECRQNELFAPLLTVAKTIDIDGKRGIFKQIREYALSQNEMEDLLDDWHLYIIYILNDIVKTTRPYSIKEIKAKLQEFVPDFDEAERITSRWIGSALGRLGFKRGKRQEGGNTYMISRTEVDELLVRYQIKDKAEHPERTEHPVDQTSDETPRLI